MSKFILQLEKFCQSHSAPPDEVAFGGRMQLYTFSYIAEQLKLLHRGYADHKNVSIDDVFEARSLAFDLFMEVSNMMALLTWFDNYTDVRRSASKPSAVLSNLLRTEKACTEPLEYVLELLSFYFKGSQKVAPKLLWTCNPEYLIGGTTLYRNYSADTKKSLAGYSALFYDYAKAVIPRRYDKDIPLKAMTDAIDHLITNFEDSCDAAVLKVAQKYYELEDRKRKLAAAQEKAEAERKQLLASKQNSKPPVVSDDPGHDDDEYDDDDEYSLEDLISAKYNEIALAYERRFFNKPSIYGDLDAFLEKGKKLPSEVREHIELWADRNGYQII